jgi:hypothetical protein
VIWESRFWKADLLKFAEQLRRARTGTKPFSDAMYVTVEKAVLIGAFVIRRLADSHKLSDATVAMELRTRRFPATGYGATLINNHRVEKLFDFTRAAPSRQPLLFLCNQAIHSYVFEPYPDSRGKRVVGLLIASERQRNRAMFAVPLSEIERAFRKVGNDYPTYSYSEFDEKAGDYKVTQYARRPRRARSP